MTETLCPSVRTAAVEALAADDPQWLAAARRAALSTYEALPVPPRAEHLWRYTDPARIAPEGIPLAVPARDFGELPQEFSDATYEAAAGYAICRDGALLRSALDPGVARRGVVLADIRAAAHENRELVEKHLFRLQSTCDGSGARNDHLSAALFAGGTFLHVPRNVTVTRPLKVAQRVGGEGLLASRSLIVLGDNSEATVVVDVSSTGPDARTLLHECTEVHLGANARLRLAVVQTLSRKAVHAPIVRARLANDARLETVSVALGGALVKSLQTASLEGRGASVGVLGLVFGDGRQHFDHHTFQDHVAAHTSSELDYRTVSGDRARSAYTGRLRIGLAGSGCSAHQSNRNLLLSEKARADSIPELEILTNDVACSHAATVGPIDPEQIYYCNGRGLDPDAARRMVVLGFLEPAVASIPAEDLRDKVRSALLVRLGGGA